MLGNFLSAVKHHRCFGGSNISLRRDSSRCIDMRFFDGAWLDLLRRCLTRGWWLGIEGIQLALSCRRSLFRNGCKTDRLLPLPNWSALRWLGAPWGLVTIFPATVFRIWLSGFRSCISPRGYSCLALRSSRALGLCGFGCFGSLGFRAAFVTVAADFGIWSCGFCCLFHALLCDHLLRLERFIVAISDSVGDSGSVSTRASWRYAVGDSGSVSARASWRYAVSGDDHDVRRG